MLDRFAEYLRKARLKKGATLQQIAAKSRIDLKFLEAIDNGNFGFLPDLYVKAFIKQYAKAIDLDENDTIKKYEESLEGKFVEEDEPKSLLEQKVELSTPQQQSETDKPIPIYDGSESSQKPPVKSRDLNKTLRILIYASGSVLALLIVFFVFFNRSSKIVIKEPPYEKILEEAKDRYEIKGENVDTVTTQLSTDSLFLQFTNADSLDSAWVMVIYDNLVKEDFLLYPRNSKTVKASNKFDFTLGNSGVIVLKLGEKILDFQGKRGSVRHYEVNKNGIQRLNSPPALKIE